MIGDPARQCILLSEFSMAHEVLRHDCVRIRSAIVGSVLASLVTIAIAGGSHASCFAGARVLATVWCGVTLLFTAGTLWGIVNARSVRRRLIWRVNYLRDALFSIAGSDSAEYRQVAGFPAEGMPVTNLFLVPQMLTVACAGLAPALALVWLSLQG